MKAIYFHCEPGHMVHQQELTDDLGKFKINEIVEENTECWQYNPDIHCPDAFVYWKKEHTEQHQRVLRRPEYSLERFVAPKKVLDYQVHFINCNKCTSGCEFSVDRVFMQWLALKKKPAQETLEKARQGKQKKNDKEINKRIRLERKLYTTHKGKDVPAVSPMEFVECKCQKNPLIHFQSKFTKPCMDSFGVFQVLINGDNLPLTEFYLGQKSRSLFERTNEDLKHGIFFLTKILKMRLNVFKSAKFYR